jgi:hypothetical protein
MDKVQETPVILSLIHHGQNPLDIMSCLRNITRSYWSSFKSVEDKLPLPPELAMSGSVRQLCNDSHPLTLTHCEAGVYLPLWYWWLFFLLLLKCVDWFMGPDCQWAGCSPLLLREATCSAPQRFAYWLWRFCGFHCELGDMPADSTICCSLSFGAEAVLKMIQEQNAKWGFYWAATNQLYWAEHYSRGRQLWSHSIVYIFARTYSADRSGRAV